MLRKYNDTYQLTMLLGIACKGLTPHGGRVVERLGEYYAKRYSDEVAHGSPDKGAETVGAQHGLRGRAVGRGASTRERGVRPRLPSF